MHPAPPNLSPSSWADASELTAQTITEDLAPAVSIVIPVYNVEDYLPETLHSLQAQTTEDWECLCIDDGSSDNSAELVRRYAERDSRIRLVSQANAGAAAARNRGLEEARGDYLLFVDADDLLSPTALERCLERMRGDQSDLCAFEVHSFYTDATRADEPCCGVPVDEQGVGATFSPEERADEVFLQIPAAPWNKMYRVAFLREHGLRFPSTLKRSEDTPFGVMCVALARRISCVAHPLYRYRQNRPGSQMGTLGNSSVYYCYIDAAEHIWQGLRRRERLSTFGVGALRLALGNALYYHPFLKDSPRLWLATRRLRRFTQCCLQELRSLAVEPTPAQRQEIENILHEFARLSRLKYRRWMKTLFKGARSQQADAQV